MSATLPPDRKPIPPIPSVAPAGAPPNIQAMTERLAKLEGAFDFVKVTIALLGAVTLGGFGLIATQIGRLDTQIGRVEGKVDAVSLKVAEMPGLFRQDLQATSDKLTLAIAGMYRPAAPMAPAPFAPRATP